MNKKPDFYKTPYHQIQWRNPLNQSLEVAYTSIRPGAIEFLSSMTKIYEVIIFTASMPHYAQQILKLLDTENYNFPLLSRSDCIFKGDAYIKDLSIINRNLKNIIIVDNFSGSYKLHPENGVPILSWFDDPNDWELDKLSKILEHLSKVNDVRDFIPKFVIKNRVSLYTLLNLINNKPKESRKLFTLLDTFNISKSDPNLEKQKEESTNGESQLDSFGDRDENINYDNIDNTKVRYILIFLNNLLILNKMHIFKINFILKVQRKDTLNSN